MPFQAGAKLGAYEILAELGRGGMGEVYRARDAKLNRDVALKVLPELLAGDADRLARFRREAQVLAALNHPNIAHIHGFEDSGPAHALVMELVEGPTLADRIALGPVPLDEAMAIARQIADALEAAHEQGIVHRDLKPANVKVRDDGTVKVLDFGLAKALEPTDPAGTSSISNSPTLTARATQMGMILGTAAYMAPEQARGRVVDRRADIWAFGVVLYEMLSGRRAFEGDDISITLASVLKEDVQWDALPPDLPASVRRLLRRCLEKDPKRRLSAIGDARLELDEATAATDVTSPAAAGSGISRRERWMWASVAGLAIVAAIALAFRPAPAPAAQAPAARFEVFPPGEEGTFIGSPPRMAVSPDGRLLVFAAVAEPGKPDQLWARAIDSTQVTPIAGTESGANGMTPQSPFWSPDSRHLAFFLQTEQAGAAGNSRLRILDLQSGSARTAAELPSNNAGGAWSAGGELLVSSQGTKGLQRIPSSGGVPAQVTTLDEANEEVAHLFPQFLPDGRRFIYMARTRERANSAVFAGSLDSAERRKLVQSDHARFAAPNTLLYVQENNLLAQTLDPDTLEFSGEPALVATGIYTLGTNGRAGFVVSDNGVLAFGSDPGLRNDAPDRQLTWLDRAGKVLGIVGARTSATRLRLSPDASRVALLEAMAASPNPALGALWVMDLARNVKQPLTSGSTLALSPTWSSTERLLFGVRSTTGDPSIAIVEQVASGARPARTVLEQAGYNLSPADASGDGKWIVYLSGRATIRNLFVLPESKGTPAPYLAGPLDYPQAALSPDHRWMAYVSNESGTYEVFVQPFPDPSLGKVRISANGGSSPRWRRDGRELFYVDAERQLIAVPVNAARDFVPGAAMPLFPLPDNRRTVFGSAYGYDVAPDGQRFLVSVPTETSSRQLPLTVTTNWMSLLKK